MDFHHFSILNFSILKITNQKYSIVAFIVKKKFPIEKLLKKL